MAASYSSFLTSSFYSPVFNTALFDGPFRFYFSQSYESTALKIYHILQSEHKPLWQSFKKWSDSTKKNVFILIYPTQEDVCIAFDENAVTPVYKVWDEGIVFGMQNLDQDKHDERFKLILNQLIKQLQIYIETPHDQDALEISD